MSTIPTTEPTVTHPAWCDQDRCSVDMTGGYPRDVLHKSTVGTFRTGGPLDEDAIQAEVYLTLSTNLDGTGTEDGEPYPGENEHLVWASIDGLGCVTIDQLEEFARWLTERAAEYRAASMEVDR
jgi:hypothetical protein